MVRRQNLLSGAMLLLIVWGCSSPAAPDSIAAAGLVNGATAGGGAAAGAAGIPAGIVDLTNVERSKAGVAPLRSNALLMQAAQIQADQMAALGKMDHVLNDAKYPRPQDRLAAVHYQWMAFGENVAYGQHGAADVVESWMNSSGHRANILNGTYTELGTGYASDASGRPYYVQVFGKPMS